MKTTKLLIMLLWGMSVSYALQGGPVQPDYLQFEPTDLQDMVNLSTGDFAYSLPLGEIPGPYGNYPLSIAYHAGITPQQEATWVGLGWSINPGVINRDVRGVPDDQFHGGTLAFVYQYVAMYNWALYTGWSYGVVSVGTTTTSSGGTGWSATLGPKINGVVGVGYTVGSEECGIEASIGGDNARIRIGAMFSNKTGKMRKSAGVDIGSNDMNVKIDVDDGRKVSSRVGFSAEAGSDSRVGVSISSNGMMTVSKTPIEKQKNGLGAQLGGGIQQISNSIGKGVNKSTNSGLVIMVPTPWGVFSGGFNQNLYEYKVKSATTDYVYGYIFQAGPAIVADDSNSITGMPNAVAKNNEAVWSWSIMGRSLERLGDRDMLPANDWYSVNAEGLNGNFQPIGAETHIMNIKVSDWKSQKESGAQEYSFILHDSLDNWQYIDEFETVNGTNVQADYPSYAYCVETSLCSVYSLYKTRFNNDGNRLVYRTKLKSPDTVRTRMSFLFVGDGGGYYESQDPGEGRLILKKNVSQKLLNRSINDFKYALFGSKKIQPLFENNDPIGKIKGFLITTANGTKYLFEQPVKTYLKADYSINNQKGVPKFIDITERTNKGILGNLGSAAWKLIKWSHNPVTYESIKDFIFPREDLNDKCGSNSERADDSYYSYQVQMNPYATQWLLTEIQGSDYINLSNNISDDIGYHVKLKYSEPIIYYWRTPYSRPGLSFYDLPNYRQARNAVTPLECDTRLYQAAFGVKELVYLESIETATHKAVFNLNSPETEERVDGKGWEIKNDSLSNTFGEMPIYVQTTVNFNLESSEWQLDSIVSFEGYSQNKIVNYFWVSNVVLEPKTIYLNSLLPIGIEKNLDTDSISLNVGGFPIKYLDSNESAINIAEIDESVIYELKGTEDGMLSLGSYKQEDGLIQKTKGSDSRYGLYKLGVNSQRRLTGKYARFVGRNRPHSKPSTKPKAVEQKTLYWGENGDNNSPLLFNWGDLIWRLSANVNKHNSMRYLKSIEFYNKLSNNYYRKLNFGFDYSLQPKTLNSYCSGRYPDSLSNVENSPLRAPMDVCDTASNKYLYGKLTLTSIVEEGCRNGKCASLPPFQFSYLAPNTSTFRRNAKASYIEVMQGLGKKASDNAYDTSYYENLTDLDVSIIASSNAMDDWGFWNPNANSDNHKVTQELADFGAAAWSLNKVKDPAGGVFEIEYERDRYRDGIDYSNEKNFVEFSHFGPCRNYKGYESGKYYNISDKYDNNLCIEIGPLYWREQCLGPRAAFWDTLKPTGFKGTGFEYLHAMGLDAVNTHLFFNLKTDVSTKLRCGFFGLKHCSETRTVSLLGDGVYLDHYFQIGENNNNRLLVLDKDWRNVSKGIDIAAHKIADAKFKVDDNDARMGFIWTSKSFNDMKGGDLRVARISLHDIGGLRQMKYLYEPGELGQLPDSAFNAVLGGRFYSSKVTYTYPNMKLIPKSRIVGIGDNDLVFAPGPKVIYPKVTVLNSNENSESLNGKTDFKYITPERGIPQEYVDSLTSKKMVPYLKVSVRLLNSISRAIHVDVQVLDSNKNALSATNSILLYGQSDNESWFYNPKIYNGRFLAIEMSGFDSGSTKKVVIPFSKTLNNYNDVFLSFDFSATDETILVDEVWLRSLSKGYFPIVYKEVLYKKDSVTLDKISDPYLWGYKVNLQAESLDVLSEDSVVYHDFTAFQGLNISIVNYRGNNERRVIPVRIDSNVYSTMVPDVAKGIASNANVDEVRQKTGKQIVKWQSNVSMDCKKENKGESNRCKNDYLYLYEKSSKQSKKKFTHIRYPVFLMKSITYGGFDNNTRTSGFALMSKTQLENHQFDPLTGTPTVTVSSSPMANGKESRKINQNVPHYSLAKGGNFSDQLFLRNMLDQTYMDKTYAGVVDSSDDWNSLIGNNDSLRSVVLKPYRLLDIPELANSPKPLVAWGEFSLRKMGRYYTDDELWSYQNAANALPPLDRFNGNHIKVVDRFFKVREMQDQLGRTTLSLFSNDGMYQTGLYFPAEQKEVAQLVLNQGAISMDGCSVSGAYIVRPSEYSILATTATTIHCSVSTSKPLVVEYRLRRNGKWSTERNLLSTGTQADFSLSANDALGYVRLYPASARGRSFVYDQYGNLIQIVSEFNTSMYYEYNSFGQLSQVRDENGVSFKTHHREFMNDSLNELEIN